MVVKNKSAKLTAAKEKSILIAEIDMLNLEIKDLSTERKQIYSDKDALQKRINELLAEIESKNLKINNLLAENARTKDLNRKIAELENNKNKINSEIERLKEENKQLSATSLISRNENQELKDKNEKLEAEIILLKSFHSNDFLVNGIKRNQKITAFAKRTNTISLQFDFPEKKINDLNINILSPDGKTLTLKDSDNVRLTKMDDATVIYSSGTTANRMLLQVKPEKKFAKGIYKFTLLSGSEAVSTILIQLK